MLVSPDHPLVYHAFGKWFQDLLFFFFKKKKHLPRKENYLDYPVVSQINLLSPPLNRSGICFLLFHMKFPY